MDTNKNGRNIFLTVCISFLLSIIAGITHAGCFVFGVAYMCNPIYYISAWFTMINLILLVSYLLHIPITRYVLRKKVPVKFSVIIVYIVFIVAGLLIAILFKPESGHRPGKFSVCCSNLQHIGTALEMYSTDDKAYRYPDSLSRLTPEYLNTIPTCPGAGRDTYSESYIRGAGNLAYTFYCKGQHHSDIGIQKNYPGYNSENGLVPHM